MILLIPGRHHIVTRFQAQYLKRFARNGFRGEGDSWGVALECKVEGAVFAVTSADHESTRRNPLPFVLRALAIHELGREIDMPVWVYGIPEAGNRPDFAAYTVKTIRHESQGALDLTPSNTIVVCATAVARLYEQLGFRVWDGEKGEGESLPWDVVERIANADDWEHDPWILERTHPASLRVLKLYGVCDKVKRLFADPLVGSDGDLTETRDYGSYVRQMDQNIELKWAETGPWVKPGRIGDIGCAVGSWIRRASMEPRLVNSDFYGIELARALYDICLQRRHNGDFGVANVWFAQRNAVEGPVFQPGTMTTIHSSSITHEIESYAGREALLTFLRLRFEELAPGGIWINRDVIGSEGGDRLIVMDLNAEDGSNDDSYDPRYTSCDFAIDARSMLASWLGELSTAARFRVFARDFRRERSGAIRFTEISAPKGRARFSLSYRDASEYLLTKDYVDNWESEMHETFCHWTLSDWTSALCEVGFEVLEGTKASVNPWILENRWLGRAVLFEENGTPCPWPLCGAVILAKRP